MKTFYLLCGLLFSGKTTLARKIVERRRLLRSPPAYPSAALTPFTLGWAQNASGAPAWTAGGVLARLGELYLSHRRIWIDRPRGLPGFPLFGPAVAQQLAAGFEQEFLQFNRNDNYAYRRSEQAMASASELASQRCVFVQDARIIFRG